MKINDLIKYLDTMLNIKINNPLVIEDMKLELAKVKDIVAYRYFVRDNIDNGTDYKNGFQKFILLTKQYLELEENTKLKVTHVYTKAQQYAKTVADKVAECVGFVEDNCIEFRQVKYEGGVKVFEDHEIRCLEAVGTQLVVCEFSRMNLLYKHIHDDYINNTKAKNKKEQLSENANKVLATLPKPNKI